MISAMTSRSSVEHFAYHVCHDDMEKRVVFILRIILGLVHGAVEIVVVK